MEEIIILAVIETLELPEFIQYKTTITEKEKNLKEGFNKLRQMYIKAFQIFDN